jgi:hypothetical protein
MKDIFFSLILGISLGGIMTGMYYNGFVAQEYKEQIKNLNSALIKANINIEEQNSDIVVLTTYIDSLLTYNEKSKKQNRF